MSVTIEVDGLTFHFPEGWNASKYDDWSYYRNQFSRQYQGIKGVDLLVFDDEANPTGYLVEVKDFSTPGTLSPSELPEAITWKVIHTLAALLPASLRANDAGEKRLAAKFLKCGELRIVIHIENPRNPPNVVDPADLRMKLKQLLRAIDPHVKVSSRGKPAGVAWTVT